VNRRIAFGSFALLVAVATAVIISDHAAEKPRGDSGGSSGPEAGGVSPVTTGRPQSSDQARSAASYLDPPARPMLMDRSSREAPTLPPADSFRRADEVSPLDARSPEEAAWLNRNGYPTSEEYLALEATSEEELAARAANGDLAALSLLGIKQVSRKAYANGYANLEEAAARGSIFALVALAESQARVGEISNSIAWVRLAHLRGDHRVYDFLPHLDSYWTTITPFMLRQADSSAARFYQNLTQLRASRGYGAFDNTLRPGFGERAPEPGDSVGIYSRDPRGR
jgi:hypothetical protein